MLRHLQCHIIFAVLITTGCAFDEEPEVAADADDESSESSSPADPVAPRAGVGDNISSCEWKRVNNGQDLNVTCDANQHPIAGGCRTFTGGQLTDMSPYEGSDISNLIENNDAWYGLAQWGGWRCRWDTSSVNNYVMALCCGT